jgi:hypothetical protein
MNAAEIIELLGLERHPEGGMFAETWRARSDAGTRPSGTCIYFLLRAGERSHWHRVDATEIWHHYAGDALDLHISVDGHDVVTHALGTDLAAGARPQVIVPLGAWQAAATRGAWTLVGCTVSPGFEFAGFDLAPEGWEPAQA